MSHLLLVDDDELFRTMLRIKLEQMGHDVVEASHGREALKLYAARPPDLMITDLVMPDQEGLETILEIRSKYPGAKIVAMSGGGRGNAIDYLKMAERLGANRVLAKPFSDDELKVHLDELLGPQAAETP